MGKTKQFLTVLNSLLALILFVSANVSYAQENQQEYCIQNNYTKGFLSENTSTLTTNCEVGEKWNFLKQADGSYCIKNLNTEKFLSDRPTELWPRCSTGEKWNLTPTFTPELNTTEYCIENIYLATQQKNKYLSDRPTEFWPRCSKGEKWLVVKSTPDISCQAVATGTKCTVPSNIKVNVTYKESTVPQYALVSSPSDPSGGKRPPYDYDNTTDSSQELSIYSCQELIGNTWTPVNCLDIVTVMVVTN